MYFNVYKFLLKIFKNLEKITTSSGEVWIEVNEDCIEVDEQEWQKLISMEAG